MAFLQRALAQLIGTLSNSKVLSPKYSVYLSRLKQVICPELRNRDRPKQICPELRHRDRPTQICPELSERARMYAYFANTTSRFSHSKENYSPSMQKIFSSSVEKTYDDLFAWVATNVNANSRYSRLLARALLNTNPDSESGLRSETQSSAEAQLAKNCMLSMLENLCQKDLVYLLSSFMAHNPEVLKVLFRGGPNPIETITMENIQISFHKMIATIADEYKAQHAAQKIQTRLIGFEVNSDFSVATVLVNVSDLDKETLKVFICDNWLVVIGKVVTPSRYGQVEKDIIKLQNTKYDFRLATAEIMEKRELKICYPIVYGEEIMRPMCMQLKLKQTEDWLDRLHSHLRLKQ